MDVSKLKVSLFYGGIRNTTPTVDITFNTVSRLINEDEKTKKVVEELRKSYENNDGKSQIIKLNLPYITPNGCYNQRKNDGLKEGTYNWVLPIDIDWKDNPTTNWLELKELIKMDKSVFICAFSPRGRGLKVLIKLKPEQYKIEDQYEVFINTINPYYSNLWGVKLDNRQAVLSQPFFLTYDESAYINLNPEEKVFDFTYFSPENIIHNSIKGGSFKDLEPFIKSIYEKQEDKWSHFGKVALYCGGLYAGGSIKKLKENEILDLLIDAAKKNKYVLDSNVAEIQIKKSFENGKSIPITKDDIETAKNRNIVLRRIEKMNTNPDIIRVGNNYYTKGVIVNQYKEEEDTLFFRNRQTIIDDYGFEFLETIKKYKDFCNVPDNINYHENIHGLYNLYYPFKHELKEGNFDNIKILMNHVFQEQIEMGYDYIQLLYQKPVQVLPVLCLVSQQQQTGKSTFLNFISDIFKGNSSIISTSDIEGSFNQHFISKLIISIDESDLHKESNTTKIKQMATQFEAFRKAKFQNESKISFFAKIILCSNNENNFINVKSEDIRYWVRKLEKIKIFDPEFEKKITSEIPQFMYFIKNRKMNTPEKKTRSWFKIEDLNTKQLEDAKYHGYSTLWHELNEYFTEWFLNNKDNEITCTASDLQNNVLRNNKDFSVKYISKVMREEYKIIPKQQRSTSTFDGYYEGNKIQKSAVFFTIKREDIIKN